MDATFDLINENDEVIGTTNRAESHANGLRHRIGAVFVFFGNKLLVQKRSRQKDGLMDHSVGGHIHQGESYTAGAAREMREEIGLNVPMHEVGIVPPSPDGSFGSKEKKLYMHSFGVFESHLNEAQYAAIKPDLREMDALIPMTLKEVSEAMNRDNRKFTGGFLKTFNFYIQKKHLNIPLVPLRAYDHHR